MQIKALISLQLPSFHLSIYLFIFIHYFFLENGGGKLEREEEKHECVVASHVAPTWDLAHNPGMCPDWEPNP